MNRSHRIPAFVILPIIALFHIAQPIAAQNRAVVGVYELTADLGDPRIAEIGRTVTDAVYISLALLGSYVVDRPGRPITPDEIEDLAAAATANTYDSIVYGNTAKIDGGNRITVSVYDLRSDQVTVTEEVEFFSLFEAFDAADELVDLLIDQISGVRVTYGSLDIRSTTTEPYRIEIDGADMGNRFTGSDRIVSGAHRIAVLQDRGGGETVVQEIPVDIAAGETVNVEITPPWLTTDTAERLDAIDREIRRVGARSDRYTSAIDPFTEALAIFDSPFYSEYRSDLGARYRRWQDLYRTPPFSQVGSSRSFGADSFQALGQALVKELTTFPEEPFRSSLARRSAVYRNAQAGVTGAGVIPDEAKITVDGDKSDWAGVTTVFTDAEGDDLGGGNEGGRDIVWAAIAADGDRIYVAIETADRTYRPENQYYVDFGARSIVRLGWNGSGRYPFVGHVPDRDWDNSRWYEDTEQGLRGTAREIIELSVPLGVMERWLDSVFGEAKLEYVVEQDSEPWFKHDTTVQDLVLPAIPYRLAAD